MTREDEPSAAAEKYEAPRLVVVYATCTLNRNFLSPYNPSVRFTPHLQRFAERSLVFRRHRTEAGQSGISYASILTGVQSDQHQVYFHPVSLSGELRTLTELYAERGYETFYWGAHPMANAALNYAQGVDEANVQGGLLSSSSNAFNEILDRLRSDPTYKAFVMTTFTVTHGPYFQRPVSRFLQSFPEHRPEMSEVELAGYTQLYRKNYWDLQLNFPETAERLELSQTKIEKLAQAIELLYRANVSHLDGLFGGLIDRIESSGLMDESLIAFTADHGELLYRDNALFPWTHGGQLTPEVLDVPFVLYGPGVGVRPGVYEEVTRSIDVFPTLVGLSGFPDALPEGLAGSDLSAAVRGEVRPPHLVAYSHTTMVPTIVLEQLKQWTLAHQYVPRQDPELIWVGFREDDAVFKWRNLDGTNWGMQAFDLSRDPEERRNLYDADDSRHTAAKTALLAYKDRLVSAYGSVAQRQDRSDPKIRETDRERLRQLGYIR